MDAREIRVLVIDDESDVRMLMRDVLTHWGYQVETAADARKGILLLETGTFDLVLTDLSMPSMSGWDVVEAVRRTAPATRVLMVTGSATNADDERARRLGLTVVHKPIHHRTLKSAVESVLDRAGSAPH